MASFDVSEDVDMTNGLDYAMTSVARDIVEPMVEEAVAHYKMFAPPYDVSDIKHEMIDVDDGDTDSESDEHSDISLGKRSRSHSISGNSDSDNESKRVKFGMEEVKDSDIEKNEPNKRAYASVLQDLEKMEKELINKDAIIAEKEQLLEEADQRFQHKHEELVMSRQEVERFELEYDAKQAEMQAIQNRMLDAEAALQIQRNLHLLGTGNQMQSPQAEVNESQLRAQIQALTTARDNAHLQVGQATMDATMARGELTRTVQETSQKLNQLQQDLQNLAAERDHANTQLTEATSRLNDLISERDGLAAKQADDMHSIESLKQLLASQESAATSYSFDVAPKFSDDEVRNLWQTLYSEIVVLCSVLNRKPRKSDISPKHLEIFNSLMPAQTSITWDKYVLDDQYRKYLVEGFVWEIVARYLEDNKVWLGKIGTDFKVTLKHIRDGLDCPAQAGENALKKYCVWRAQGAHQLVQFGAHDDMRAVLAFSIPFMELLRPFCSLEPWMGQGGVEFKEIYDGVYTILATCQKLDHIFMTSLAHWKPKLDRTQKSWGQDIHHHPEWFGNLKPVAGKSTFPIAFQINPYLLRIGNADGEDYQTSEIIAKGSVMPAVKF